MARVTEELNFYLILVNLNHSIWLLYILDSTSQKLPVRLPHYMFSVTKLLLNLWDHTNCSPPGFSVHGIFQGRILEQVTISCSRGIFLTQGLNPCLLCLLPWLADSLPLSHVGSPYITISACQYIESLVIVTVTHWAISFGEQNNLVVFPIIAKRKHKIRKY